MHRKLLIICLFAALLPLRSCTPAQEGRMVVATLRGPSSVAMIQLIDSLFRTEDADIEVKIFDEPMQLRKMMLEGSADFAVLPMTMAALLYNKGVDYRVAAVPLWGSLYLCGTDTTVRSLADLRGRKVHLMAKGMTPDLLFRHLLSRSGLEAYRDVELDYRFPTHTDLANAAIAGRAELCVLSEPYVSQVVNGNSEMHILLDLNQLWQSIESSPEAETAFLCKGTLADSNRVVISYVVDAYRASSEWVKAHPDSAAALCVRHGINPDTLALIQSIPRTNINVMDASEAEQYIFDYLKLFFGLSPETVGGRIPDGKFICQ